MIPHGSTSDNEFPPKDGDASPTVDTIDLYRTSATSLLPDPLVHVESDSNAPSKSGIHRPEHIVLEGHRPSSKDDPFGAVNQWLLWWPVAILAPTYALHRYYRRHRPRRLPPLTPLKLPGLYGLAFTSAMLYVQQAVAYTETVTADKRLHIIDSAADRAAAALDTPAYGQEFFTSLTIEPGLAQVLKRIREEGYYSSGTVGKLAWWDRHLWSSQASFDRWSLLLLNSLDDLDSLGDLPHEDLEICATHLANRSSGRLEQISSAVGWSVGFSVPFAMLARWSGRRALFLPMNGLQRLLISAWMYVEVPVTFRELWYLRRIREKDVAARMMVDLFGSFDEEFKELGFEYDDPPDRV